MRSRIWLVQALPLFAPSVTALCAGKWGLSNFTVQWDTPGVCHYSFTIEEGLDPMQAGFIGSTSCQFDVQGQGQVAASQVNVTDATCKNATQYHVNTGWDPSGFVTVVVTNENEQQMAYFGYEDAEVLNAIATGTKVEPAYIWGTYNCTDSVPKKNNHPPPEVTRREDIVLLRHLPKHIPNYQEVATNQEMKLSDFLPKDVPNHPEVTKHIRAEMQATLPNRVAKRQDTDMSEIHSEHMPNHAEAMKHQVVETSSSLSEHMSDCSGAVKRQDLEMLDLHTKYMPNQHVTKRQDIEMSDLHLKHDPYHPEITKRDDAEMWTVQGFTRSIDFSTGSAILSFYILDSATGEKTPQCTVTLQAAADQFIANMSFQNKQCSPVCYFVSWKYKHDGSAVMTVIDSKRQRRAWFEWNGVNTKVSLPDAGPNRVEYGSNF